MFISYAQNFEDVMLWRALKHIKHGFYIDAGAWSPDLDSVTRAFYERGWRGINIEPNPKFHEQLESSRPRDINLKVAISDVESNMAMNFLANPGLSTLDDAIAQQHQLAGWEMTRREVEVKTLAAIWQQHVPDGQSVHFLKVDVEGFEKAALLGNDWARYRPWVVVVEAILPMSQVESHSDWEPTLLKDGYKLAYLDGLNRFYVSEEHTDLLPAFKYPPNVFDEFILAANQESEARVELLQPQLERAGQRIDALEHELADSRSQAEEKLTAVSQQLETRIRQLHEAAEKAQTLQQQLTEVTAQAEAEQARVEQLTAQLSEKGQALEAKQSELEQLHAHIQWLQNEWDAAKAKIDELNHSLHHWWTVADRLTRELQTVYRSKSWRITAPLRAFRSIASKHMRPGEHPWYKRAILGLRLQFDRVPALKKILLKVIALAPPLDRKLRHVVAEQLAQPAVNPQQPPQAAEQQAQGSAQLQTLTPHARRIYSDLKRAMEQRQKGQD